jgi:hypothetical protein
MEFRAGPITIKRVKTAFSLKRPRPPAESAHFVSANSVGVLPVTCRNAYENAGTLA